MFRMSYLVVLPLVVGCSSSSSGGNTGPTPDAGTDAALADTGTGPQTEQHAVQATVALAPDPDGQHVTFGTQNGSTVSIAKGDIVGKALYWATTAGGEPITNASPIDQGMTTIADDLTAKIATPPHYADGPFELAMVISLTGLPPTAGPNAGDLAGFDNSPPPEGEPPVTGVSVRVRVKGADADVTLGNRFFIRYGQK